MNEREFQEYCKKAKVEDLGPSGLGLGFTITEYSVGAWCPTPDGSGKPTAVAISLKLDGSPYPHVLRLKSKGAVEMLIRHLQRYQKEVFGE
jgi:hypothetical protein